MIDFYPCLNENVGAPMSTMTNTPGMGTAQPASMAAMTGAQQYSPSAIGSGDKWGSNAKPKKKKVIKKKKKNEGFYPTLEDSINPTDKIGVSMAKKMGVPIYFKKGKNQTINQKKVSK